MPVQIAGQQEQSIRLLDAESPLLEVNDLKKYFPLKSGLFSRSGGSVKAVDGISFTVQAGQTLGIVGESGCGKSTLGRNIIRLQEPTSGRILYNGQDMTHLNEGRLRHVRRDMQIIFQDPYASLNAKLRISEIVGEPLRVHKVGSRLERQEKIEYLMEKVGLEAEHLSRFPHEFSGGQRQRIGIARALSLNPKLIVCDEPVSALDVSVQSQVINLLQDLQDEFGLTYLFISHDLSVVRHISDRVAVMYLGKIVELAETEKIYQEAAHPYTQALLSAIPVPDPVEQKRRQRIVLKGDVPSPVHLPSGCRFHTRCPLATDHCREEEPVFEEKMEGHWVACHYG
ncbi:ABC transporter ATP-binding protein [Pseudogracilibacillus auburnensis]|uniref:Peptide/nickel transport system ATP-binding protein/oligopeptide transport system ATP-binding protein n=1 Tax=Pseudogracilibacillus auburnensis TaxID=1494959 RepID=A0A2V3VYY8_9BACI|nr:dipeptide ABC transporter ATP-binding protein [Pseudogracilibacillus auburnensis]PXW85978.1 peptide/nickel transport system ATP-binding protein/oligopeptide transport system ATP-binding protein [Pseudogracilibacillus auburnensis]